MSSDFEFQSRDTIFEALRPFLNAHAARLVRYGLEHTHHSPTVESAARHLGVHRRALEYREARAGLMTPQRILSWCRAFHAAELLGRTEASTEQISEVLGYSSPDAMRKALRRLGLTVTGLRRPGGPERSVLSLVSEFRRASAR